VNFRRHTAEDKPVIVNLFTSVFTASEGAAEGALIGNLAASLFETTDDRDLFNFVALDADCLVASVFFTRLQFNTNTDAFILAPVAVRTDRQYEGIGRDLICYGLNSLTEMGVNFVFTYGDLRFYRKVGFLQISPTEIRAPFRLSQPEGWLGQSLSGQSIEALAGTCTCVSALNHAVYW